MKKIIIFVFALVSCSKQNLSPLVIPHELASKNSAAGQLAFQFGSSPQILTRSLQYSNGAFALDAPITVPEGFTGSLGIHFPDSYHVFTNASFSAGDKDLLLPQKSNQTKVYSITDLGQFFSDSQSTTGILHFSNSDQVALSIMLRTPPAGLDITLADAGAQESLHAGSFELLLLKSVIIKNPLNAPVELSYSSLLEGTLHQERAQFSISYLSDDCGTVGIGAQTDTSASQKINLNLLEISDALPSTFLSDLDSAQKKIVVLAPGEEKTFGIYGEKGRVEPFIDHGDAPIVTVDTHSGQICENKKAGGEPICRCGGSGTKKLSNGNWSKRSTLALSNISQSFALRFADLPREQDPNDRNFEWASGSFSVFQP